MGTRSLTVVISDNVHKIAQYGQYDGYPGGQGLTVLNFCINNLSTKAGIKKFKQQLNKVKLVNDSELNRIKETCDNFNREYPSLCRDLAADILKLVLEEDEVLVYDSIAFAGDSVFCEWCYVIDLDKKRLEIYKGFNREPLTFEEYGDYFCFKSGGDGDNGETLMYILDDYFEDEDNKG